MTRFTSLPYLALLLLPSCVTSGMPQFEECRIEVATLNILNQSGGWPDRKPVLETALRTTGADITAFQEIMIVPGKENQAQWLTSVLHQEVIFDPMVTYPGNIEFGLAIASRYKIEERGAVPLPAPDDDPRVVQYAVFETPAGSLTVLNTHLSYRPDQEELRQKQVGKIVELMQTLPNTLPILLMGDFNAVTDSPTMQDLTAPSDRPPPFVDAWVAGGGDASAVTWNHANPLTGDSRGGSRRIDYILIHPPQSDVRVAVEEVSLFADRPGTGGHWPSDHAGVRARILLQLPKDESGQNENL